tara:strand:- start:5128 stop:5688 length:561 start_codon:yes stop_codon:yes gene_type:complete
MSSKKIKSNHKKKPRTKRKRTTKRNKKNRIGGTWVREQELINNILDIRTDFLRLINACNKEKDNNDIFTLNTRMIMKAEKAIELKKAYKEYAEYIEENEQVDLSLAHKLSKDRVIAEANRIKKNQTDNRYTDNRYTDNRYTDNRYRDIRYTDNQYTDNRDTDNPYDWGRPDYLDLPDKNVGYIRRQ